MKLISICLLSILCLSGCASNKPEIIYKTVYQEVKVPVVYKIDRPKRPKFTTEDTSPSYLLKILEYVKSLEIIIDEHKTKGD